ncbi:MAG: M15 family metallopeptidase [Chitinophagaceae bacterium]
MAKSTNISSAMAAEINHYLQLVDLNDHLPINTGLRSANQQSMISVLGSPLMPLTTNDQPDRASPLVNRLRQTVRVSQHVVVTAIRPAIESLKIILTKTFQQERGNGHDLESVLSTDGMLVVRLRRPTSGLPSTKISNHAWGTAIDMKIIGHSSPGNTGHSIPRFIAVLLPFFNEEGWFSGIAFHDSMHFEVAEGTISQWLSDGRFAR